MESKKSDELYFVRGPIIKQSTHIKELASFISVVNSSVVSTLYFIAQIAVVSSLFILLFHFIFEDVPFQLFTDTFRVAVGIVTVIQIGLLIRFKTDLYHIYSEALPMHYSSGSYYLLRTLTYLSLRIGFLIVAFASPSLVAEKSLGYAIVYGYLFVSMISHLAAVSYIRTTDKSYKEDLEDASLSNIRDKFIIDKSGGLYKILQINYMNEEGILLKVQDTTGSYIVDPEQKDSFEPDINHDKLEKDEEVVDLTRYRKDLLASNFTDIKVELILEEYSQDTTEDVPLFNKENPYLLSAEELQQLEENNLLQDYFKNI